jgi:hypothetical protein
MCVNLMEFNLLKQYGHWNTASVKFGTICLVWKEKTAYETDEFEKTEYVEEENIK